MARIKIRDLPKGKKITKSEMRKVLGGAIPVYPIVQLVFRPTGGPTTSSYSSSIGDEAGTATSSGIISSSPSSRSSVDSTGVKTDGKSL
jgi:hypothetical protein